ncbi:MAG: hypothetical protein Q4F75_05205 [Pseudomonadota bacterium]|nr:hypothetical protein [Pseudomonadota bacterium]
MNNNNKDNNNSNNVVRPVLAFLARMFFGENLPDYGQQSERVFIKKGLPTVRVTA